MKWSWLKLRRWRVLMIAMTLIAAVPMISAGCADRLIMPPEVTARVGDDVQRRLIPYTHGELEVFETRSAGAATTQPSAMVLQFSGGNAADVARTLASRWKQRPLLCWAVNYPGYGGSTGRRTLNALADAALDAFDELRHVAGDRPIFVEGFSLGTVPALHIAAKRKVHGLILQNPPPLPQLIRGHFSWWNLGLIACPVSWQVPQRMDSIENARRTKTPAIFLTAELDRSVPLRFQQEIVAAYAGEKHVILQRGADHVAPLSDQEQRALDDAMDWLISRPAR